MLARAAAHPTAAMVASRWPYPIAYLAAVIAAEVLISIPGGPLGLDRPFQPIGLSIHILLVFTLMFLSVVIQPKDATLAPLLVAASLASLIRVFSLAVPRYNFLGLQGPGAETDPLNTLPWLALVSVPLLVSIGTVAYVQRLRPSDLGLLFKRWIDLPIQAGGAKTGVPLALLQFAILRIQPDPYLIHEIPLRSPVFGGLGNFFSA